MEINRNIVEEAYAEYTPGTILEEKEFLEADKKLLHCFTIKAHTKTNLIEYSLEELLDLINCFDDYGYDFKLINGKIYDEAKETTYTLKDWKPEAKKILQEIENE